MISVSSIISAVFLFSIVLCVVCWLRWRTNFLKKGGLTILLLAIAMATVRLLLPVETPITYAIRSWTLMAAPQRFFRAWPLAMRALIAAWVAQAIVVVRRDVAEMYRAYKQCRGYTVVECERVQAAAKRLSITCPVVVSPDVKVPYAAGIFRHTIYFPAQDFSETALELALAHEAQHIRSHDAQIKLLFWFLSVIMWWNPAVWIFRDGINDILELRCDRKVTAHLDAAGREAYWGMLLEAARYAAGHEQMTAMALDGFSGAGKEDALRQRCVLLSGKVEKPPRLVSIAMYCAVVVAFLLSYLVVVQPASAPSIVDFQSDSKIYYEEDFDGLEKKRDYAFIFKDSDGRYWLYVNYEFSRYLTEDEVNSDKYGDLYIFEEGK